MSTWSESRKVNPEHLKLRLVVIGKPREIPSRREHYIHSNLASQGATGRMVCIGLIWERRPTANRGDGTNPIRHLPLPFLQTQQVAQRQVTGISFSHNISLDTEMYFSQYFVNLHLLDFLSSVFKLPNCWKRFIEEEPFPCKLKSFLKILFRNLWN